MFEPDWKKASEEMPLSKPELYYVLFCYYGMKAVSSILSINVQPDWFWAYIPDRYRMYNVNDFSNVVKPEECEARKKEPERELLCPFCESENCEVFIEGFFCKGCGSKIINSDVQRINNEYIFYIHDKLNGDKK